jgi:hypothetical protein
MAPDGLDLREDDWTLELFGVPAHEFEENREEVATIPNQLPILSEPQTAASRSETVIISGQKRRRSEADTNGSSKTPPEPKEAGSTTKRRRIFLGVFPPPRRSTFSPYASTLETHYHQDASAHVGPILRPRKDVQGLKASYEEGESEDPNYQFEEQEEGDKEYEGDDGVEDCDNKTTLAAMRRSLSGPSISKPSQFEPPRATTFNNNAASPTSPLALAAVTSKAKRQTSKMKLLAPFVSPRPSAPQSSEMTQASQSLDPMSLHKCSLQVETSPPCPLPDFLNLHYCPELKVFACFEHGTLLPCHLLLSHLDRRHKFNFNMNKLGILKDMVEHLLLLTEGEVCTSLENISLPKVLKAPISISRDIKSIGFRFQCPSCEVWIPRNDSCPESEDSELFRHLERIHNIKRRPKTIVGSWCQKFTLPQRIGSKAPKSHVFQLLDYVPAPDAGSLTLAPSFSTRTYNAPLQSSWFNELRWPEHRRALVGIPINTLQNLVMPPTKQRVYLQKSPRETEIEGGLLQLRKEITEYLRNAQMFVSSLHWSFRDSVKPR